MLQFLGVGDLILNASNIEACFEPSTELFKKADIVLGQVESPHTDRGHLSNIEPRSTPAYPPEMLDVLPKAGLTVASLGGNHIFDQGYYGVYDTIEKLKSLGIETVGAGLNLSEAKKPVKLEKKGIKIAILQYNATGPSVSWATPQKAGAAYIRVLTVYSADMSCEPGSMPDAVWTITDPRTLQDMKDDILALRKEGYLVVVGFHIGRMNSPDILTFQFEITHAAIDCGAEMILCHHTHEPRGIEVYRGKPIFHGLGNFVTLTDMMNATASNAEKSKNEAQFLYRPHTWQGVYPVAWRMKDTNKEHETGIPNYVFSHLSRNTLIVRGQFDENGLQKASFIPCYIDDTGAPVPVKRGEKGDDVFECFENLNKIEELNTKMYWNEEGTEIMLGLE